MQDTQNRCWSSLGLSQHFKGWRAREGGEGGRGGGERQRKKKGQERGKEGRAATWTRSEKLFDDEADERKGGRVKLRKCGKALKEAARKVVKVKAEEFKMRSENTIRNGWRCCIKKRKKNYTIIHSIILSTGS